VAATNSKGIGSASSALTTAVTTSGPVSKPNPGDKSLIQNSPPAITGSPVVGRSLAASTGSWTNADPTRFKFQWQRCANQFIAIGLNSLCQNIAGQTKNTYTVTSTDVSKKLRISVTAGMISSGILLQIESFSPATAAVQPSSSPAPAPSPSPSPAPAPSPSPSPAPCNQFLPLCRIGWRPGSTGSVGKVAVLDTGVEAVLGIKRDTSYPGITDSCNTEDKTPSTSDDLGHGTAVSSIISGTLGVAPGTSIVPIRIGTSGGSATYEALTCGINKAIDAGVDAINISYEPWDYNDSGLVSAIKRAQGANIPIAVAAGNYPYQPGQDASTTDNTFGKNGATMVGGMIDTDMKPGGLGPTSNKVSYCYFAKSSSSPEVDLTDDIAFGTSIDDSQRGNSVATPACAKAAAKDNVGQYQWGWQTGTSLAAPVAAAAAARCHCNPSGNSDPNYGFKSNPSDTSNYGTPFHGYLLAW
jgi:hypothetical protein